MKSPILKYGLIALIGTSLAALNMFPSETFARVDNENRELDANALVIAQIEGKAANAHDTEHLRFIEFGQYHPMESITSKDKINQRLDNETKTDKLIQDVMLKGIALKAMTDNSMMNDKQIAPLSQTTTQEKGFFEKMGDMLASPLNKIKDYFEERSIKKNVLKSFVNDLENNFYERAAVDELMRQGLTRTDLEAVVIIHENAGNPIMEINFYDAGMFSGTVERAMSFEFARALGFYFEDVPVGALNESRAVRKLNLQATSPFIEEQKRAYMLYRYGID